MELALFATATVVLVVLMKVILHDKPCKKVNDPCKNCKEDCNGCILNKRS